MLIRMDQCICLYVVVFVALPETGSFAGSNSSNFLAHNRETLACLWRGVVVHGLELLLHITQCVRRVLRITFFFC